MRIRKDIRCSRVSIGDGKGDIAIHGGGLLGRVDRGGCPPRPPTDPGLHITPPGSSSHEFATRAIRRRYVDMVQVTMYLPGFSSTAHETAPPSLDGVPRVGSPAATVL